MMRGNKMWHSVGLSGCHVINLSSAPPVPLLFIRMPHNYLRHPIPHLTFRFSPSLSHIVAPFAASGNRSSPSLPPRIAPAYQCALMSRKNGFSIVSVFVLCSMAQVTSCEEFELENTEALVECVQCVQLWRSASAKEGKVCTSGASTCRGNACFMRQCKHCPVYQYMSGCVNFSPWQLADLEMNRRTSELRMRRVGAVLLCEDTFNQTTCVCNRRDKCNSIHSRLPFATYSEGLFRGVVNFDTIIAAIDPRYLEVMSGYHFRFLASSTSFSLPLFAIIILLLLSY